MIQARDGRGLLAQFLAIGLCALVAFPLLAAFPDELYGAHAPVGIAMLGAAFVFGATMQIVLGCGSSVLVNAGSGNLMAVLAGQSWGIVYGLGFWGAKVGQAAGMDVLTTAFWSTPDHAERLQQSLLTDVTSLTNIGIIIGAFVAMRWRRDPGPQVPPGSTPGRLVILLSGLVLGYSARIAFGCNVGAYFSGIATGSFHGWAWFAAAFAGSALALHARPRVLQWLSLSAAATPGGSVRS